MDNNGITRPVWVEINLDNIKYNLKQVRNNIKKDSLIMAVVKADAYGHGVLPVAKAAVEAGSDRLAVALPEEGKELRDNDFKLPIQILGEVLVEQIPLLVKYNLIPTVSKLETAQRLNQLSGKKSIVKKVHVKIDTGMGRIGVFPEDAVNFIKKVDSFKNIEVEGIMTHFAKADEKDKAYTYKQWERFNHIIKELESEDIDIPIKQAANSATIIDLPEMSLNMVRPGIMMYGLRPSHAVDKDFKLKPVLSWKAKIVYLKEVPPGTGISYGATYITDSNEKIATLPLGYADGYPRLLSNKGEVLIKGKRAPIRGRVCMDQFMVDVTKINDLKVGDLVTLIGKEEEDEIPATELADLVGTINYEITCGISKRVPRKYK
ncbi:MAG: alanine racemase [Halanaerobiales bacterium]|nr:alanine racemase [Halanaerobiales bacterium]